MIDDLCTLPEEICDRYPHIIRTVLADVSCFGSVDAGSDLLEPLRNTPAGAVLRSAMRHARQRYDVWRAHTYFCSPEAAKARAEARKQWIAKERCVRSERKAELDKRLLSFRRAIDEADIGCLFAQLRWVDDPLIVRAVGGIAYSVILERLRAGGLKDSDLGVLARCAVNYGGHWAKLLKMAPSDDRLLASCLAVENSNPLGGANR